MHHRYTHQEDEAGRSPEKNVGGGKDKVIRVGVSLWAVLVRS